METCFDCKQSSSGLNSKHVARLAFYVTIIYIYIYCAGIIQSTEYIHIYDTTEWSLWKKIYLQISSYVILSNGEYSEVSSNTSAVVVRINVDLPSVPDLTLLLDRKYCWMHSSIEFDVIKQKISEQSSCIAVRHYTDSRMLRWLLQLLVSCNSNLSCSKLRGNCFPNNKKINNMSVFKCISRSV
jgi:hypothetical protein